MNKRIIKKDAPVKLDKKTISAITVSYTHLRAHETVLDLVCRLLLEKKNKTKTHIKIEIQIYIIPIKQ